MRSIFGSNLYQSEKVGSFFQREQRKIPKELEELIRKGETLELPAIVHKVGISTGSGFGVLNCYYNHDSDKHDENLMEMAESLYDYQYNTISVVISDLKIGEELEGKQYIFVGHIKKHPKYGLQFVSKFRYVEVPCNYEGLKAFLMTLPNIKYSRSKDILDRFGVEGTIDILENNPIKLTQISGITAERAKAIHEKWMEENKLKELYFWLSKYSIDLSLAQKVYKEWGDDSLTVLQENPYELAAIKGITFSKADKVAIQINPDIDQKLRLSAAILCVLKEEISREKNLCCPREHVKSKAIVLLRDSNIQNDFEDNAISLCNQYYDEVIRTDTKNFAILKNKEDQIEYLYIRTVLEKETFVAESLGLICQNNDKQYICSEEDIIDCEQDIENIVNKKFKLDLCQKDAISSAFGNRVTVITGGGGTGKSTICRCIVYLASKLNWSIRLMSPTGKASQVLKEKTKHPASTIHRSLLLRPGDCVAKEFITEDICLIDEISMIDLDTIHAVMGSVASKKRTNFVFVGDVNQLPSVSAGNFLDDVVKSDCANVVILDSIHRQSENSYIPIVANDIANGKHPVIPKDACDISYHPLNASSISMKVAVYIDNYLKKHNIDDLQILTPQHDIVGGRHEINNQIQFFMANRNNTTNISFGNNHKTFYLKDKVVQMQNDYEKNVVNGEIGYVIDIGTKVLNPYKSEAAEQFMKVDFDGNEVIYKLNELDQIDLAWCCSVHKYQGSQSDYILFSLPSTCASMLASKELMYTAITRAAKKVAIIGDISKFENSSQHSIIKHRFTNTSTMIKQYLSEEDLLEVL